MRKYQEIWEKIKKDDKAVILIVHPRLASRVRKAVIKEKDGDLVFKVNNEQDRFRLKISYDPNTGRMEFILCQWLGITEKVL